MCLRLCLCRHLRRAVGLRQRPACQTHKLAIGFASCADTLLHSLLRHTQVAFYRPVSLQSAPCSPRPPHHRPSPTSAEPTKAVQPQKSISARGNFDFHGSDLTAQCAYSEGAKGCGSRYKSARWGLPEGSTGASPRTP